MQGKNQELNQKLECRVRVSSRHIWITRKILILMRITHFQKGDIPQKIFFCGVLFTRYCIEMNECVSLRPILVVIDICKVFDPFLWNSMCSIGKLILVHVFIMFHKAMRTSSHPLCNSTVNTEVHTCWTLQYNYSNSTLKWLSAISNVYSNQYFTTCYTISFNDSDFSHLTCNNVRIIRASHAPFSSLVKQSKNSRLVKFCPHDRLFGREEHSRFYTDY